MVPGMGTARDRLAPLGIKPSEFTDAVRRAGLSASAAGRLDDTGILRLVRGDAVAKAYEVTGVIPGVGRVEVEAVASAVVEASEPGESEGANLDATDVRAGVVRLARTDFATFCEYVARDEETGERIRLEAMHEEMCSAVESHGFLLVMSHPESGKTNLLVVMRVLFRLGTNPNLRIVLASSARANAIKNLASITKYIESSAELREVFPKLRPAPNDTWTTEAITVERSNIIRDPSVQTVGVHGSIQGARIDEVYADDLLDYENTRTKALREDTSRWFRTAILARANVCVFLTNAWHPEDLAAELVEKRGFVSLRYPVLDAAGESSWPSRWSIDRIAARRRTVGELEFARLFLCKPRDDGAQVFSAEALERCKRRGLGYGLVGVLDDRLVPADAVIVTGVDLAVTRRLKGAVTAMYTTLVHPSGLRQIIGARSGRWGARQILDNIAEVGDAFGGVVVVEDNGAQRYLVEIAQELDADIAVPVLPHTTGRNKVDPELGIDSMAAEFDAGKWLVPIERGEPCEEIAALLGELAVYDPASHPGDRLMALWFARTYALRILLRRRRARRAGTDGDVRVSVIG